MKVCDLPYRRVSEEEIREGIGKVLSRIREAKSAEEILQAREDYLALLLEYQTNSALAYMRYSINTVDEFYVAENAYYDETGPCFKMPASGMPPRCWILRFVRSWRKSCLRSCFSPWKRNGKRCPKSSSRTWLRKTGLSGSIPI